MTYGDTDRPQLRFITRMAGAPPSRPPPVVGTSQRNLLAVRQWRVERQRGLG